MSIGQRIRTLRRLSPTWRATALAEVAAQWHDPFRVLIACLLSLRTKDETTGPAAATRSSCHAFGSAFTSALASC